MTPYIKALCQPYGFLFLMTGLTLLRLWFRRREFRRRLIVPSLLFALLYTLSMPISGHFAMASLERNYPPWPLETQLEGVDAIVVLSGYAFPTGGHRLKPELAHDTLYRCLHALELYRAGGARPIMVTGGEVEGETGDPPLGVQMRDFFVLLGVRENDLIVEARSKNTHENAVECGKILRERKFRRIILITDAAHMRRAVLCYEREGLEVVASGCQYRALKFDLSILSFYPTPNAANGVLTAFHEWIGLIWYRWNGWI
jgi:uncharacterized SAM-binding protein YcdF (DUF218 family)